MRVTTMEERIRIGKLSQKGFTDREIAGQVGLSIFTIRKWLRRGKGHERKKARQSNGTSDTRYIE